MQEGFGAWTWACALHNTYSDWIVGVLDTMEMYDRALLEADWSQKPRAGIRGGGGGHVKYVNTLGLERAGFQHVFGARRTREASDGISQRISYTAMNGSRARCANNSEGNRGYGTGLRESAC